ncbi:MAG TPA: hypothetical protein DCS20_03260 [Candidatus Yonathbacteria bacterium]|nr:hypothetical protein [Candidatus Yonathbacteria bacterium]
MLKKITKFFRGIAILAVVLSISFSNIPFYSLTKIIDSSIATRNIVDKAWHLSQDDNVVDKFTSYRHLAEKVQVYKAYAASLEYVGGAEASGNSASYNVALTSLTGGTGGAVQSGDLVIVATGFVQTSNLNPGVGTAGYTEEADLYQNDSRDANFSVNWKYMTGAPDTTVNCLGSGSATNGAVCEVHVWRNADPTNPLDVVSTTAQSNNSAIPNSPPITPITTGAVIISAGLGTGAAADTSITAPTGYGNQVDISVDPGNAATVGIASKAWSGAGTEDPAAWTAWTTTTSDSWAAVTLAIRPTPTNTPPTLTVSQPDGTGDTVTVGDLYNITYNLDDPEEVVTAAMYYDTDATGLNGTAITGSCTTAGEGTGVTCSWDTTGMTPGSYYVYGLTSDGIAAQVSDYSPGVITINAPATLTIGATAGSKTATLNSGATSQYANSTTCNSTATCAAFTILSSSGETLNSIKITETGTTNASNNLSNLALFYDTDGNYSNGVTGQYGATVAAYTTETATVSGSLALVAGTTYYFYVRTDLINGANDPAGGETINFQIAANADVTTSVASTKSGAPVSLAGTTTVKPNATAVSYQVNSDGARSGYSATVTGNGFGVAPIGSRGNCAGAVNTGCVQFVVGGTATVATGDVSAWANRSLSFTVNSALASNGGASALQVSAGAQADATPLTFFVYPTVSSVTNCDKATFPTGAFGREYDATDAACPNTLTDGAVVVTGDHLGSAGAVTILGSVATQSSVAAFCGGSAYTSTCTALRVPTSLASNTGNLVLTRSSDGKTDTLAGFRVLPRITGFTPASQSEGGSITVDGNHFCQGVSCPTVFSAGVDDVVFTSAKSATTFTSWSAAAMATVVPSGAVTGDVVLTSNGYASNGKNFTLLSPTPDDSTSLTQKDGNAVTIAVGGTASTTPIQLSMTMQAGVPGGTLYPQIEYKDALTALVCGSGACAAAIEGTGAAGPGPATGSVSITPTDDVYQWQARVCRNNGVGTHTASCGGTGDYPSTNWVLFGGNGAGATDFKVDTVAPIISSVSSSGPPSPGTNTATITWTTNELATSQVQYQAVATASCSAFVFANACSTNNDCTSISTTPVYSPHTTNLSNLNSGTDYCYRVRSKDAAGNEKIDTNNYSFSTSGNLSPSKTTRFHIAGVTGAITNATPLSQSFLVAMPENATTTKSIFVEIKGIYTSGASSKDVSVQVNSETAKTYVVPASSTSYFKIIHQVNSIAVDPGTNTLIVTPQSNTTLNILSADIYVNYTYTP